MICLELMELNIGKSSPADLEQRQSLIYICWQSISLRSKLGPHTHLQHVEHIIHFIIFCVQSYGLHVII